MFETIRNAWKIEDLKKKLLYTLLILALVRIGAAIPVPFLTTAGLQSMVSSSGGLFSYLDLMTGGSFSQSTLFALSISPYITSSIVVQLLTVAIPYLENLAKEGEEGRKKINKITRWTTLGLALLQAYGYMRLLASQNAITTYDAGWQNFFVRLVIVMCFTAGSMLVVFLGERIDEKGIGNGISMILFVGIASRAGAVAKTMYEYVYFATLGVIRYWFYIPIIVVLFLFIVVVIIIMTNAERRIPVQYAKRVVGRKQYGGQSTYLPIKVNMSGVLPVIFASTLLAIPTTILAFLPNLSADSFWYKFLSVFQTNTLLYAVLYFVLIIAFNYFYLSIQYNPIEISNNLRKNSGGVPGIRPGKPTSDYIARIVNKTTFLGGLFLSFIAILPIILGMITGMNISLGGTSVIILVGVALDTVRSLESQMMMRHYKGFLE
jgi:preprotein translocase subunit SecY